MPPTVPINHYDGPRNQQNRTKRPILLFHANIFEQYACFEHSNFFKVKVPVRQEPQGLKVSQKERPRWKSSTRKNRTGQPGPKFNYELFNCNNFNIRYWSWNYRGCWHQTCPPIRANSADIHHTGGRSSMHLEGPIRPIVSRITIHWPSFYNVVTGKTLALPNLIALQHIPLSPAGVIAKRPAPIALPNSCAA